MGDTAVREAELDLAPNPPPIDASNAPTVCRFCIALYSLRMIAAR